MPTAADDRAIAGRGTALVACLLRETLDQQRSIWAGRVERTTVLMAPTSTRVPGP